MAGFYRKNKMLKSDPVLQDIAKPIWNKFLGIYPQLKKFEMPVLRFDGRIKVLAYSYYKTNVIRISKGWWINNSELFITDIIPHEIAHQIDYYLHGDSEADVHSALWQEIMRNYGIEPLTHYEVIR